MNRKAMILLSAALMTVAVSCEETEKQEEEKLNPGGGQIFYRSSSCSV